MLLLPTELPQHAHTRKAVPPRPGDSDEQSRAQGQLETASDRAPMVAVAQVMSYFELKKAAPRMGILRELLSKHPWTGSEGGAEVRSAEEREQEARLGAGAGEDRANPGGALSPTKKRQRFDEKRSDVVRPRYEELERRVQCSRSELRAVLQRSSALEIDGEWAFLDRQYERDVTECVLSLVVEHEWPLDAVPLDECVAVALEQVPPSYLPASSEPFPSFH